MEGVKKMKVISLINNKGGSSKTSVSLNISGELSKKGKVLYLDIDPQMNGSYFLNGGRDYDKDMYDLLFHKESITNCIISSKWGGIDYVMGSFKLGSLSNENDVGILEDILKEVRGEYDYVVVDTSPYFDFKIELMLSMSDLVIVPVLLDVFSSHGLQTIITNFDKYNINRDSKLVVVPVQVIYNSKLHRAVMKQLEDYLKGRQRVCLTNNRVSYSVEISNSIAEGRILTLENKYSKVGKQMKKLGKEVEDYVR